MNKKFYLQVECRYSIPRNPELEFQQTCFSKFMHSGLFDTENECITLGNSIIEKNKWLEQHPGNVGQRLKRVIGYPLTIFNLKNNADIFISVKSLDVVDPNEMDKELQKFNVQFIDKKIP